MNRNQNSPHTTTYPSQLEQESLQNLLPLKDQE